MAFATVCKYVILIVEEEMKCDDLNLYVKMTVERRRECNYVINDVIECHSPGDR